MEKKTLTLAVAFLLVGLCCSNVFALTPMGPLNAGLSKGQYNLGVDYSYSQLCIDFDYSSGTGGSDFTKHSVKMDMLAGRFGYGVTDKWEGFVQLGGARARASEDRQRHKADGLTFGFGTKVTLHEKDKLKWGGLFQAKWAQLDGDASGVDGAPWTGDLELDIMQIQVAVGPTYQLKDCVSLYGGPFWYYLDGEKEYDSKTTPGDWEEYDMSNCSDFGGFIGAQVDITSDAVLNLEVQMTEDDEVLALSFVWRH